MLPAAVRRHLFKVTKCPGADRQADRLARGKGGEEADDCTKACERTAQLYCLGDANLQT